MSRALSLATVTILAGLIGVAPARAENLEAGKPPQKIFSDTCSACHKSSRGLLRTVSPGSLSSFLRQHYTTSSDMASALSSYLINSGGATERTVESRQGKRDAKQDGRKDSPAAATALGRAEPAADGQPQSGRALAKQKRGKKGLAPPTETETTKQEQQPKEAPKADTAKVDDKKPEEDNKGEAATREPSAPSTPSGVPAVGSPDGVKSANTKVDVKPGEAAAGASPDAKSGEAKAAETKPSETKPSDETKPSETKSSEIKSNEAAVPLPPGPTSNPKPARRPRLTLPGFPLPTEEPDEATSGGASAADAPKSDSVKAAPVAGEQSKSEPQKVDPTKPNEAKSLADQAAEGPAPDKPAASKPEIASPKAGEKMEPNKKPAS